MDQEKHEVPNDFYDDVDQIIELANRLAEKSSTARISSAILYAAARYNAFNFYALDPDVKNNKEEAIKYYCEQYRKMLLDHFDDLA